MKNVLNFLEDLVQNNNRDWFEANKARYQSVQAEFNDFAQQLIDGLQQIDPALRGVTLKDSTYRIYRDIRFSPNKIPYKNHIGVYVAPGGKKSSYAGYYFHVEPGDSLLAAGLYCPEPKVLHSVRDEIFANGPMIASSVDKAASRGFELDISCALKRTPKGYPTDSQWADWLRLKEFTMLKHITPYGDDLLERTLADFSSTYELNSVLNRAVEYALREM